MGSTHWKLFLSVPKMRTWLGWGLILQAIIVPSIDAECPSGVAGWFQTGPYCYHESIVPMNWSQALDYCQTRGGYLAEVTSVEEQAVVDSLVPQGAGTSVAYWIGLKRIDRSNDWAWATSGNQAVYFDWDGGEPNDAGANNTPEEQGENCVHIDTPEHSNGKWNDFPCHCVDQCKIGNTPNVPIYALCEAGPLDETPSTTAAPDYYKEHWRPQFHFSPETGWINDPNGLVYWGGEYHLFYQHYPDDTVWGAMHWGHATSQDLLHWTHLPIALYPDSLGSIFSGSAVGDPANTTGWATEESQVPLVAMYSYNVQTQAIAYSLDGETFTKFEDNPVIPKPEEWKDFRDPRVLWHEDTSKWVAVISQGQRAVFYGSPDMKSWELLSEFKPSQNFGWECPDLFQLSNFWVLTVANNRYFIGNFDGTTFTAIDDMVRSLDYGRDNYAAVTYSDLGGRIVSQGWMNSWGYANKIPTSVWRGSMTVPRELIMTEVAGTQMVLSNPVLELESITQVDEEEAELFLTPGLTWTTSGNFAQAEVEFHASNSFEVVVSNSETNEALQINYNHQTNTLTILRERSGVVDFDAGFSNTQSVNNMIRMGEGRQFRMLLDWSSAEIFIDNGLYVMTSRMFPTKSYDTLTLSNSGSEDLVITLFKHSSVQSVWCRE